MMRKAVRIGSLRRLAALLGLTAALVLTVLLTGCATYFAGTRYDKASRQSVRYLRAHRLKLDTGGSWSLGVQASTGEGDKTMFLILEHRGKELMYIRAQESMIVRAGVIELRLSVAKGRNERQGTKGNTRERAFYPVTPEEFQQIASARNVQVTVVTSKGFVRFPIPRPVQVDMMRFYQEEVRR